MCQQVLSVIHILLPGCNSAIDVSLQTLLNYIFIAFLYFLYFHHVSIII